MQLQQRVNADAMAPHAEEPWRLVRISLEKVDLSLFLDNHLVADHLHALDTVGHLHCLVDLRLITHEAA